MSGGKNAKNKKRASKKNDTPVIDKYRRPPGPSRCLMSKIYIDEDSRLLLIESCKRDDYGTVLRIFRTKGELDADLKDIEGRALLHHAAAGGYGKIVECLIQNGADVNITTVTGVTPLHLAVKGKHAETVQRLLISGADAAIRDGNGLRPIDHTDTYTQVWNILTGSEGGLLTHVSDSDDKIHIPSHIIPCAIVEEEHRKREEEAKREQEAKAKKKAALMGK